MRACGAILAGINPSSVVSIAIVILILLHAPTGASAQSFTTLHSFDLADGAGPDGTLIQGTDGNLYGTTSSQGSNGQGTIFKITPGGTFTTVYDFCSLSACADGAAPMAGLVQGTDGNFYGTTSGGGANGAGTVFKIRPRGVLTTLYSFCAQSTCIDGATPMAGLVQASDGNFYGTTTAGGFNLHGGTIFKITPSGVLTTLQQDLLNYPLTGTLIQATDGNLYGTTSGGGTNGSGTVFKVSLSGALTTLYSFCAQSGCLDGQSPLAGVIQSTDGNFYGTTSRGGGNLQGTVFKLTPSGILTTIHTFCSSNCLDGGSPVGAVIQANNGSLYGTTTVGGANIYGTIFQINSKSMLTTLHSFCAQSGCPDGQSPNTSLTQHTNGSLYGTTFGGGASSAGTVFMLSLGLPPFVEVAPSFGKVGNSVKILGTNLTGSTGVTFNGTPAVFKVLSSTLISVTVPTGATSGFVRVTIPGKTLKSNRKFLVR